jgi:hypothetical protein
LQLRAGTPLPSCGIDLRRHSSPGYAGTAALVPNGIRHGIYRGKVAHRTDKPEISNFDIGAGQAMEDLKAKLEKLLSDAEDCELIARLAADAQKRELFRRLAADLRAMARDVEAVIARRLAEGKNPLAP